MRYYPVFLDLGGKKCLVAGLGRVGRRKVKTLLECGPYKVIVIDPVAGEDDLAAFINNPNFEFHRREFLLDDLDECFLVFAATADAELNLEIGRLCRERGIPCNIADAPDASDFIVPAMLAHGDVTVAISTGGDSPALARRLRIETERLIGPEWGKLSRLLGMLRPLILDLNYHSDRNAEIFRALAFSELLRCMRDNTPDEAGKILADILPSELHAAIPEIIRSAFSEE